MPVGVELAAEITFPSSESTVSGLLLATSQILGVTFTIIFDMVNAKYGAYYSILGQIMVLIVGIVSTIFTPNRLLRQAAFKKDVAFEKIRQEEK